MKEIDQKPNDKPSDKDIIELKELIKSNQSASAEIKAKKLINQYPKSLDALNLLGVSLIAQNKLDDSEKIYLKLLEIKPDFAEALNNLGNIYMKEGKNDKAIYYFEKALLNKPNLNQASFNLAIIYTSIGNALQSKGKIEDSIKNYEYAIKNKPDHVDAYNNLGVAFQNLDKLEEAAKNFKKAIQIKVDYFEAYNNLGNIQRQQGKIKESIKNFKEAIKIKHDYIEAYSNLGAALHELGNFEESFIYFQQGIRFKPNFSKIYNNLAASLTHQGRANEAAENYNKAFQIEPKKTEYAINANLILPMIPESREEINWWRNKYISAIDLLRKYKYSIDDPQKIINPTTFSLSYSDHDNVNIVKKTSKFFRDIIPAINYKSQKSKNIYLANNKFKKIRLGLISAFFTDHTIGKLYKGLIKNINKDKFELIIFHTSNTKPGIVKDEIDCYVNKTIILSGKINMQHKQIENETLDIIFYPDIGMNSSTYFLAHARLAPVQIVSWGHPETSGIDTIDYFLSSSLIENEGSKSFYSEKLICLDRMPVCFVPPQKPNILLTHSDFGLSEKKILYCCPQTLFKIHPDFDVALANILKKDLNAQIVMIETKYKSHVEKLKKRWKKNFPSLCEKVIFLKSMSLDKFLSLIKISNVLLDPFYFGSGLSFFESMIIGTPTITMPSTFMRGRVAAGGYKQMKILNPPIAHDAEHYVELAVKLANDLKNNSQLRKSLKQAAELHLFNDLKAVKQFEVFFEDACNANATGLQTKD